MRRVAVNLLDGAATGLAVAVAVILLSRLAGRPINVASAWVFYGGIISALAALIWAAFGRTPPPGVLWRRPRAAAPAPAGRVYWMDRSVTSANTWLVAGLSMLALSFLMLLL